jgi:hypothetical protein
MGFANPIKGDLQANFHSFPWILVEGTSQAASLKIFMFRDIYVSNNK